jgi:hypothetical protein
MYDFHMYLRQYLDGTVSWDKVVFSRLALINEKQDF